jgi:hypothetical protein
MQHLKKQKLRKKFRQSNVHKNYNPRRKTGIFFVNSMIGYLITIFFDKLLVGKPVLNLVNVIYQ